jgi:hypothetical protein
MMKRLPARGANVNNELWRGLAARRCRLFAKRVYHITHTINL